ncbi:helix-turn-helix domain-containing protein [Chryseobacterium sp. IT-36CA2]|uniref:helix-turn-helix domain-containing protein n=1 Tax=Chryseobacterium sp. IT-36CA2 TaxID=3026460 RepID=UPI0039E04C02
MNKIFFLIFLAIGIPLIYAQHSEKELKEIYKQIEKVYSKPDSAMIIANRFLPKLQGDNRGLADLHLYISQCYTDAGQQEEALQHAKQANIFALNTSNYELIARTSGLLATQYRAMKLYTKAKNLLRSGILDAEKISDKDMRVWVKACFLEEYAMNLAVEKKYDSAVIYNHNALNMLSQCKAKWSGVKLRYAVAYVGLGDNYIKKNELDSAEYYLNKVAPISKGTYMSSYAKGTSAIKLSLIYSRRKQYQRAIDTLKSVERSIDSDLNSTKVELYGYLSQNYKAISDFKNYIKYNEIYSTLKNKLSNEERKAIEKSFQMIEEEVVNESKKSIFSRNVTYFTISFSIIFIGFLLFYYRRKRKNEKIYFQNYIKTLENKSKEQSDEETAAKTIPKASYITEIHKDTELQILKHLENFEKSEKYTDPSVSLSSIATDFKTNTRYLSEVINKHRQKNFKAYLNELRVDYISKKILTDPLLRKYKISALAEASGFSSAESFSKTFKKITGILPSVFIENISAQINEKK